MRTSSWQGLSRMKSALPRKPSFDRSYLNQVVSRKEYLSHALPRTTRLGSRCPYPCPYRSQTSMLLSVILHLDACDVFRCFPSRLAASRSLVTCQTSLRSSPACPTRRFCVRNILLEVFGVENSHRDPKSCCLYALVYPFNCIRPLCKKRKRKKKPPISC